MTELEAAEAKIEIWARRGLVVYSDVSTHSTLTLPLDVRMPRPSTWGGQTEPGHSTRKEEHTMEEQVGQ